MEMGMENILKRQRERLEMLSNIREALERINRIEELLGYNEEINKERMELRKVMMRIVRWKMGDD